MRKGTNCWETQTKGTGSLHDPTFDQSRGEPSRGAQDLEAFEEREGRGRGGPKRKTPMGTFMGAGGEGGGGSPKQAAK